MGAIDSTSIQSCMETSVLGWEFDPPPEVEYVHTYQGRVGEAW